MMPTAYRTVVMAHGLEGSPEGAKVRAFRAAGLPVVCPDGRQQVLADRVAGLLAALAAEPEAVLVGSSYGGLAALAALAALGPAHRVRALVLLAPALSWREPPVDDPASLEVPADLPCVLFHGLRDDVIPVAVSDALAARCPHIDLRRPDDGHRLSASLPRIVTCVRSLARWSTIEIRGAVTDDIPALTDVERAASRRFAAFAELGTNDETVPVERLQQAIDEGWAWVAADDRGVVGFLVAEPLDDAVFVVEVSVHPRAAGQRLAARLIDEAAAQARRVGRPALTLTTFRDVPWNAPYYRRLGFVDVEPTGALAAQLARERDHGLDPDHRVAMRKPL